MVKSVTVWIAEEYDILEVSVFSGGREKVETSPTDCLCPVG